MLGTTTGGLSEFMSAANIIGGIIFGAVGFVAFVYGKKRASYKPLFLGLILMIYPYFIPSTLWLYIIGGLLTVALFIWRD